MLEIEGLTKIYPGGAVGIEDVSIAIPPDHPFAILGTSGAGKTTLLQCLGRFLEPTSGTIRLDGKDIRDIPREEFRRGLGIVFQALNLFPHLSTVANMTLSPTIVYGESPGTARKRAHEMLERLGIAELAESYPSQISGGQAQRVAIGRALLLEPEYLLLDEPTSALDKDTTRSLAELLGGLKTKTTFVFVTHDLPFARMLAESAVLMKGGRVVARGSVEDVEKSWGGVTRLRSSNGC